jgi:quinol monooxygenase YgiN
MVIEHVQLSIVEGRESEFETSMQEGRKLLLSGAGCQRVVLARGVERPSQYLLMIHWDAVESHTAYTRTPAFEQFRALLGSCLAGRPAMEHFAPVE